MLRLVSILALFIICCMANSNIYDVGSATTSYTKMDLENIECTEVWCEQYTYADMFDMYEGLFKTKLDYFIQELVFHVDRDIVLYEEGVKDIERIVGSEGDGDSCCQTLTQTYINSTLSGIYSESLNVVQLKAIGMYQFISQATCVGNGSCAGSCKREYRTVTVLVYDKQKQKAWFQPVLVPAYCSCKRSETE